MKKNYYIQTLFLLSILSFSIIVLQPWLASLISPPINVYLLNLLASLILLFIVVQLLNLVKEAEFTKNIIFLMLHHFSSFISSIKWALEMLLNNEFGPISNQQREIIKGIHQKNEKIIDLIDDLFEIIKNKIGKNIFKEEICNIEKAIEETIKTYQSEIERKKIKIFFNKPPMVLPLVKMSKQKMKLVIQTLLDNAIKYSFPGGEIIISIKKVGNYIEFKIEDKGIGMDKKEKRNIFKKIFRGKEAVKQEPLGYGLSLYLVRKIIKEHKGKIWFDSEKNKGTTFYFTLPLKS